MKARIEIDMDGAAFDGTDCGRELARVLRSIASAAMGGIHETLELRLRDSNGNICGRFEIVDE